VPTVLQALSDADPAVRKSALLVAGELSDPQFVAPVLKLLEEKDPQTRKRACYAAQQNWDRQFVSPMMHRLCDPDPETARAAQFCLQRRFSDVTLDSATLRRLLVQDSPASQIALQVLETRGEVSRPDLLRSLGSTNLPVVSIAFNQLRYTVQLDELSPLITNSLPMARMMALGVLVRMADKPAVDRVVSMLHDPNETIRWRARSALRRLTGQKLGAEPAAYEKWWTEHKDTYSPPLMPRRLGAPGQ
jgi:HEAT repeat protein